MSFEAQALRIANAQVPDFRCAFLTGSTARGTTTPSSDIDTYVISAASGPFRKTFTDEGRLVEFFVNTDESMRRFADREVQARLPTTIHMLAESVVIAGEDYARQVQQWARSVWAKGPHPYSEHELSAKRYSISAYVDDLVDSGSLGEAAFVANELVREVADLLLVINGHWSGRGKWLERRLRNFDPSMADAIFDAYRASLNGEPHQLVALAKSALEPVGGYLQAGYQVGDDSGS